MDDILVMGSTSKELLERTERVLQRLVEFNLKLNPEKCRFFRREVRYLGLRCNGEGIHTDPERVRKVLNFPVPKNRKELQSWLGLANYYRKFIPNYSDIVEPAYVVTRKDVKFEWNDECQKAFNVISKALTEPPILAHPDPSKRFVLYTDASNFALGAVLEQEDKVIAYASRTLLPAERRYAAVEREILGIVWSTDHWRHFLVSNRFTCFTDSKPLQGEIKKKTLASRLLRFKLRLSEFDFEIKYRKGVDNGNADALSRILSKDEDDEEELTIYVVIEGELSDEKEEFWNVAVATAHKVTDGVELSAETLTIGAVTTRRRARQEAEEEQLANEIGKEINNNDQKHARDDDLLQHLCIHSFSDEVEAVDDKSDQEVILRAYHDSPFGGHFGNGKTYDRVKRRYQWVGMKKDVENHVKTCLKCQLNKKTKLTKMPLQLTQNQTKPMERLYLDIVEGVPESNRGNTVILSMLDGLTKFVQFEALPDQQAHTIAKVLFENIVCRFTIPKEILTDRGSNFCSLLMKEMCRMLKVKKLTTSAYRPSTNNVERMHSWLGNYLRTIVDKNPANWDEFLALAAHAYNNTKHSGTNQVPMEALFGFTSEIPVQLKRSPAPLYNPDHYPNVYRYKSQLVQEAAREALMEAKRTSKKYADRKTVMNIR